MLIVPKKLRFNLSNQILLYSLKKRLFLVIINFNKKKYIQLPKTTNISKQNFSFLLSNPAFYSFLLKWIELFYKPLQKNIFFKGLGFKYKYSDKKKINLELKLGFSHLTTLIIPYKEIKVFLLKKNRLVIQGFDYSLVTNFAQKIKRVRFPNSYTGKGFWYKNEFINLKPIKKS